MLQNLWKCLKLSGNLGFVGFVVYSEKFGPSKETEHLVFMINSVTMTVRLTTEKKRKILDLCQEVLRKESVAIRLVSKLLGKFTSSFQAIKYGNLH